VVVCSAKRRRWRSAREDDAQTTARLVEGEVEHLRTQALLMLLKAQFELYTEQREGTSGLGGASVLDGTATRIVSRDERSGDAGEAVVTK
jgi:hypothetical protein